MSEFWRGFLQDLENAKVQTRLKRQVYEEVREILALVDDLESGRVSPDEAKTRFQALREARVEA